MFDSTALTDEQSAAASHEGGHLLIVAGAGTGKTTTLAARLAHLVEAGVPPERILLLTFSRRAAAELVARAEATTGHRVAAACWAGTFHAVANRFLRRYGRAIGLEPSFTVLDQADAADLLALLRDELRPAGEPSRRRTNKDLLAGIWSRCVNTRRPSPRCSSAGTRGAGTTSTSCEPSTPPTSSASVATRCSTTTTSSSSGGPCCARRRWPS